MKKSFLVFSIMFVSLLSVKAQINIIPKLGVNLTGISYIPHPYPINDILVGMQIGVATEIMLNDRFSIQPELLYTQKGSLLISNYGAFNNPVPYFNEYTTTTRLHYLEIPVLAKMKFGKGNFKFYLGAGLSAGMAVFATQTSTSDLLLGDTGFAYNGKDNNIKIGSGQGELKRFDIGWQAAMGFEYKKFVLDLRYGQGFTNIFNKNSDYDKAQNKAFGATLGYIIPFKLK